MRAVVVMLLVMMSVGHTFAAVEKTVLDVSSSNASAVEIKSFKDWKQERIQESVLKVSEIKARIEQKKRNIQSANQSVKTEAGVDRLSGFLNQEQQNLEMNKQLGVSDYFLMYLTGLPQNKDVYTKAASQMTSSEMGELMLLYAQQLSPESISSEDPNLAQDAKGQKTGK